MDRYQTRRDKLRKLIAKSGAKAMLVTNFTNVTYLTGFTGDDSYLLVKSDESLLLSDPRYTTQIEEECPGLEAAIRPAGVSMLKSIERVAGRAKLGPIAIEADSMSVALHEQVQQKVPGSSLVNTRGLVERLRVTKDQHEIEQIRQAVWQAEKAFGVLRATLRPEQTEKEVADELEHQMRLYGAKGASFPPIVAVGDRAALPHARPTNRKIGDAPFVLVDWGADGSLYKSDLTRVLITGKISPKLERIYRVVLNAQEQAIAAIGPGVSCQDVDRVAREIIREAGFGRYFGHGLGHGIGLEIHEAPRLAANQPVKLEPGMVVTVEPGIYLPGMGGVRIEDDVLVTKTGYEVLTGVSKQWEEALVH